MSHCRKRRRLDIFQVYAVEFSLYCFTKCWKCTAGECLCIQHNIPIPMLYRNGTFNELLQNPRAWPRKASAGWRMWEDENWKQFQDCRCRILPPCYNIWSFLCVYVCVYRSISWLHCAQQAGHRIRAFGEIFSAAFSLVKDLCSDSPRMESFKASAVIRSLLFNNGPTWTLVDFVKVHWNKQLVKSCVKQHPA